MSDEVVSTVIPYKNPPALIGYYLSLFSIIGVLPIFGLPGTIMGLVALYLGLKGLKNVKRHPQMKGTAHAWIAILVGGFFGILTLAWQCFGIYMIFLAPRS